MIYQFKSRVRYSETDRDGKLTLGSVIDHFQDCSTFQSEHLGLGIDRLREKHRAWLVSAWQIVIRRRPHFGEEVTAQTWAYDFKGFYGYRNFALNDGAGERLVLANSLWVYVDTESGHPVRVDPEELAGYTMEEKLAMEYAPRKIALPKDGEAGEPFTVRRHQLDTNGHVNNGQYVRLALDYLPEEYRVGQLRAEYKKQARLGDVIVPRVYCGDGKTYTVALNDTEGKPYAVAEFTP